MTKVILVRYGELYLKGRNRKFFESLLQRNMSNSLNGLQFRLYNSRSRTFISDFNEDDYLEIIDRLSKVFGIHSMSLAVKIPTDVENICATAVSLAPKSGSFRVTVNRADKRLAQNSIELSQIIGGHVQENCPWLSVDLHNPDTVISIDIREDSTTYIFYDTVCGAEGMPVGCAGKGMLLLSGGIDSPVAGYMMAKRGMMINAIHFQSYPFTSLQAKEKVVDLAKIMRQYCGNIKLLVISFTKIQQAIHEYCREDFMITVMRRIMLRIAERAATYHGCGALLTGESLGQVASQTLESIAASDDVATIPVFRPLIGMDKSEIITISRKIGAFETSILPYEDCCTVFLPKNPIIKPKLEDARSEEAKIPNLNELIDEALQTFEVIRIE